MQKAKVRDLTSFVHPLYTNRLMGRLMYLPGDDKNKKNILFVYDINGSIDSSFEYINQLRKFGSVTCADLPGLGGMESFFRINTRPTTEAFGGYLASLIKLRFRGKRITIVAVGYGFTIATRMLQDYPEIAKKTDLIISIGGYSRYDDIYQTNLRRGLIRFGSLLSSLLVPALLIRLVAFNNYFLKKKPFMSDQEKKFSEELNEKEKKIFLEHFVATWKKIDLRTYLSIANQVSKLDNCNKPLQVPLWQIFIDSERMDNQIVEQHLKVIYKNFHSAKTSVREPNIFIPSSKLASKLLPIKIKRLLSKEVKTN